MEKMFTFIDGDGFLGEYMSQVIELCSINI